MIQFTPANVTEFLDMTLIWPLAVLILFWIPLGYYWPKPVLIYFSVSFVILVAYALICDFMRWLKNPNPWRP